MNIKDIQLQANVSELTAEILKKRGLDTKEKLNKYLNPELDNLQSAKYIPDIHKVKRLVEEHIQWDNKIFIYGDYDVDGTSSSAIMAEALNKLGARYETVISNRFVDGYGLSMTSANKMIDKGASLVITVDCGISNHKEIEYLKDNGVDVIVIDHHEANEAPDTLFVDLKVKNGGYKFKEMCATGVTWKVGQYLTGEGLFEYIDIVALATIADVVPLKDENRIIVKHGLEKINNNPVSGIKALKNIAELNNKKISSGHIGFQIAPRINAKGRLDTNKLSYELLVEDDYNKALKKAEILDKFNEKRKIMSERALKDISEKVSKDDSIIIAQNDIGKGIVGLVAGDLKEKFEKPSIVFGKPDSKGVCKGSGRGFYPLHMKEALDEAGHLLETWGGHAMAGGLSIKQENIEEFKKFMLDYTKDIKYKTIKYDLKISIMDINKRFVKEINDIFAPVGAGNPSPKLFFDNRILKPDTTRTGEHLIFKIGNINGIGFGLGEEMWDIEEDDRIVGSVDFNEYRGRRNLQIKAKKIIKKS